MGPPLKKTWIAISIYLNECYGRKEYSWSHTKKPRNRVKAKKINFLKGEMGFLSGPHQVMPLSKHTTGKKLVQEV